MPSPPSPRLCAVECRPIEPGQGEHQQPPTRALLQGAEDGTFCRHMACAGLLPAHTLHACLSVCAAAVRQRHGHHVRGVQQDGGDRRHAGRARAGLVDQHRRHHARHQGQQAPLIHTHPPTRPPSPGCLLSSSCCPAVATDGAAVCPLSLLSVWLQPHTGPIRSMAFDATKVITGGEALPHPAQQQHHTHKAASVSPSRCCSCSTPACLGAPCLPPCVLPDRWQAWTR